MILNKQQQKMSSQSTTQDIAHKAGEVTGQAQVNQKLISCINAYIFEFIVFFWLYWSEYFELQITRILVACFYHVNQMLGDNLE